MNSKPLLSPSEQENYIINAIQQQLHGANEKEIETELYALLLQYHQRAIRSRGEVGRVSYHNPHHIDGLLKISTTESVHRVLIEAKTNISLSRTSIWAPLAQAVQYLHTLKHIGELLPGVILIATEYEWHVAQSDVFAPLLSRDDLPWESTPSTRSPEIELAIQELRPVIFSYSVDMDLDINEALGEVDTLMLSSRYCSKMTHEQATMSQLTPYNDFAIDESRFLYDGEQSRWYIYDNDHGIWVSRYKQEVAAMIAEEARQHGMMRAMIVPTVSSIMESLERTRFSEEWPQDVQAVNLPSGSWIGQEVVDHSPLHYQKWSLGCDPSPSNVEGDSTLSLALQFSVKSLMEPSSDARILLASLDSRQWSIMKRLLGSYSQSMSPATVKMSRGKSGIQDSPITLCDVSTMDVSEAMRVIERASEGERFLGSTIIFRTTGKQLEYIGPTESSKPWVSALRPREEDHMNVKESDLLYHALTYYDEVGDVLDEDSTAWRYSGDNIRLWMEECLEPSMESAVLNEDLRDSYNNWLEDHGYAHISHKVFLARLEDHPLFKEWKLVIARSSRYGKLKLSSWSDPKKSGNLSYQPRRCDSGVVSHVKYMKFK